MTRKNHQKICDGVEHYHFHMCVVNVDSYLKFIACSHAPSHLREGNTKLEFTWQLQLKD